jgi:glyoxylase-like metal-dependent hydrolase (beta-lactamase superfamily II)
MSNFDLGNAGVLRRGVLAGSAAVAAMLILPRNVLASSVYKFKHGAFDITVVSDGFITLPPEVLLPDANLDERSDFMARLGGNQKGAAVQANIPLIRHGSDLILIDNGSGANFQPSAGRLAENLKTLGVAPDQITKVVFTHVHPDHSGATTTADGKVLYPNAHYYVSEQEYSFWMDEKFEDRQPSVLHGFAKGAKRDLSAVRDRLTLLKSGDEVLPGMTVIETRGHTPGHISVELSGDDKLVVTGDACTNDTIFFARPDWHFGFDTEAEIALKSRQRLLDRAASEKMKMLGYHWTYPGVGYAERSGTGYRFIASSS